MARRHSADDTEQDPSLEADQSANADTSQTDSGDWQQVPEPDNGVVINEEMLDAIDSKEAQMTAEKNAEIKASVEKLISIATAYPTTTPASQTAFGFGGIIIQIGDLRNLALYIKSVA